MKNKSVLNSDQLVQLTDYQIQVLELSEEDIKIGKLIPHDQVNEDDLKWLNEIEQKSN